MSWSLYQPQYAETEKFIDHPAQIVESKNLATTPSPNLDYELHLSTDLMNKGKLSSFQQETIKKACQSMKSCGAFLLGDGTGTGKGRVLAGCAIEYAKLNSKAKIIWVSVNKRLFSDAVRDVNALTPDSDELKWSHFEDTNLAFMSYHDFTNPNLIDKMLRWLDYSQAKHLIMFDEAHCLRHTSNISDFTLSVMHRCARNVHFLYSTATPASTPSHLRFGLRLGLWGPGSSFQTFQEFQSNLTKCGTTAMELTAMQLKSTGKFVSRQLSTEEIQVDLVKHSLSEDQVKKYNDFSDELRMCEECGGPLHQLFFQRILASFKIPTVIELVKQGLSQGFSVIVSMQTTGQASDDRHVDAENPDYISSAWDLFQRLTQRAQKLQDFPQDALDALISEFGEENVAEITGRSRRITKNGQGMLEYRQKPNSLQECLDFQSGKKRIALISKAGSTGISLHDQSDNPRLQICLELPWSSEDFMQQCGRTHRSNAKSIPKYIFVYSDIPAELRFASSISEKLRNMGALSRGDRDTSSIYKIHKDVKIWNTQVKRDAACRILFHVMWRHVDYCTLQKIDVFSAYVILRMHTMHTTPSIIHLNCWKTLLLAWERKKALSQNTEYVEPEQNVPLRSDIEILNAIYTLLPQCHYWCGLKWTHETHLNFSLKTQKKIEQLHLIRSYDGNFINQLPCEIFEKICSLVSQEDFIDCADLHHVFEEQKLDFSKLPSISSNMIQNRALGMNIYDQKMLFNIFSTSSDRYGKDKAGVYSITNYLLRNVKTNSLNVKCKKIIEKSNGITLIFTEGLVDTSTHSNIGEFYVMFTGNNVIRASYARSHVFLYQPYEKRPFRKYSIEQWREEISEGRYKQVGRSLWEHESLTKLKRLKRQALNLNKVFTLSTLNAIEKWADSLKIIIQISAPFSDKQFNGLLLDCRKY